MSTCGEATVRWTSNVAGPDRHLVMTYVHRGLIDGTQDFPGAAAWVRSVQRAGEPFVFGFEPAELAAYLADRGWCLIDDLSTPEALAQYGLPVARVPSFYRIAHASLEREVDQSDLEAALREQREAPDALLLGRVTFEQMRGYWPWQADDATGTADSHREGRR